MAYAQDSDKLPIDPNVRYGKLDNGLTYYIRHNNKPEKRADFYIAQKVGSMQEDDSQSGLAHFLEHMAFNGTKHFPGRKTMLTYLETNGAKFGLNVNAYTSFDETVYNLSDIPVTREGLLDSCLLILHDWSGFISLDDKEIDKERPIIKEEWRTRGDAQMRVLEKQLPILYAGSKYANRLPIGKMDIVENFPYDTLRAYYHKWYRPDLQAIIIVGDIDADKVEAKIKTLFADIPKPVNPAKRLYYPVPDNTNPIISVVTDPEASKSTVMYFIKHDVIPDSIRNTKQGYYISIIKNLASQMLNSRLAEIAQKPESPYSMAYSADENFFVSKTKDAWTSIAFSKEGQVQNSLATLIRENERVKKFGFTDSELNRAKSNILKAFENAYNNRNTQMTESYVNEYVQSFTNDDAIPGIEYEYGLLKQIIPSITTETVNAYISDIISDKNVVITVTGPEKDGLVYPTESELLSTFNAVEKENITAYQEEIIDRPLIDKLPTKGKIVKEKHDDKLGTTVWTLSNGMKVILKKTDFKDDQIILSAISKGGTSLAPDSDIFNAGLISSVPGIGGLGTFSNIDLQKALAGKSVNLNTSVALRTQGFSGLSSINDQETLFQLIYLYFTSPRKDVESFQATKSRITDKLKNRDADPITIFSDSITKAMYGENLRAKKMKLDDAQKLNYDRIIDLYKICYANPGAFVFTFVGTVDESRLRPLVEQYLASLPSGNKNANYANVNLDIRKGIYNNSFTKAMQTPKASVFDLYTGRVKRDLKNTITLDALKQILDIVYTQKVREDEGGTYGVSVSSGIMRIPEGETLIQMYFDTEPGKVNNLNNIIKREMEAMANNGPQDSDFNKVKEYMNKKYQEDIKQNSYWSEVLTDYYFYNEDSHTQYQSILNSLTKDDVKNLAKKIFSQNNLMQVIMTSSDKK